MKRFINHIIKKNSHYQTPKEEPAVPEKNNGRTAKESRTINRGLTRKEELDRVRGYTRTGDPERGPSNK